MIFTPNKVDVDLELRFLSYLVFDDASNLFGIEDVDFSHTVIRKIFGELRAGTIFNYKKLEETGLPQRYIDYMDENQVLSSAEMERIANQLKALSFGRKESYRLSKEKDKIDKASVSELSSMAKSTSIKDFTFTASKMDSEVDKMVIYDRIIYDPRTLCDLTGYFSTGWICGIGASTGVGKTLTAIQIARSISDYEGSEHAYYSLEMDAKSFLIRCLSIKYYSNPDADWRGWETVRSSLSSDKSILKQAVHKSETLITKPCLTVSMIRDHVKKLKEAKPNLKTIVIDHFHIIQADGNFKDENQSQDSKILALDAMAKELDVRVLLVFQTKKKDKDNRFDEPFDSDIRGSKLLVDQLWWLILLWRDKANKNVLNYKIAKSREEPSVGTTGQIPIRGTYLYDDTSHYNNPNY